jgi:hypothetical protein
MAAITAVFLVSACSDKKEESTQVSQEVNKDTKSVEHVTPKTESKKKDVKSKSQDFTVMDQPVDFSSTAMVDETIKRIREEEGNAAVNKLNNALKRLIALNPDFKKNRRALFEAYDGRTPNEIIAEANR